MGLQNDGLSVVLSPSLDNFKRVSFVFLTLYQTIPLVPLLLPIERAEWTSFTSP
jgi:hypothetical protein